MICVLFILKAAKMKLEFFWFGFNLFWKPIQLIPYCNMSIAIHKWEGFRIVEDYHDGKIKIYRGGFISLYFTNIMG